MMVASRNCDPHPPGCGDDGRQRLTLPADQPPEPAPSVAELQRLVTDLPYGACAFLSRLLRAPGLTAGDLCRIAEAATEAADESALVIRGSADERAWRDLAKALYARADDSQFPHPPKVPLTAEQADASIRRRAAAAGIATSYGGGVR